MTKYFACSDIHSGYTPWMTALDKAGFDKDNPDHKIILCGDLFDRLDESQQTYDFAVEMLNKDKMIYVKGNHEELLEDFLKRGYPLYHDWHNGTVQTITDLTPEVKSTIEACAIVKDKIKILQEHMVNYFETKDYIFVHSFVPKEWKTATEKEWSRARWVNPFEQENFTDKIIVHGHWHNSEWWSKLGKCSEFGEDAIFDICEHNRCIGLDACTALTNKVNIFVFEE